MRFCFLTSFYPPESFGGDGVQVSRLAEALARAGHSVTVVHSGEAYRALGGPNPPDAGSNAVRRVRVDAGLGVLSPLAIHLSGRPLLTRRALEDVLGEPFDVLHFHNPSLIGGPAAFRFGSGLKLLTAHEMWLLCPTHTLWRHNREVCDSHQCIRCSLHYRRPPQPWRWSGLLDRSVAELDALIAPSDTSARLHARFADRTRIARLDHFVPEPPVVSLGEADASSNGAGAAPYLMFAGRLEPLKGIRELVEEFRGRRERLIVAGDGSLEPELRSRAAELPNVELVGWVEPGRLASLYAGAIAVVVPSLGHEAFGLAAVEAWAQRTPVVMRRFGALAELAERSDGALAYSSEEELSGALDLIAADEELRGRLASRGRAAYERLWTEEVHLRGYMELISDLARERGDDRLAESALAASAAAPLGAAV
jgi:glycosyltransferase involved in cell wall biosynthesis